MKKMIYLTYAEPPSGVFSSQVIDVIKYLQDTLETDIRLVSFISMHDYSKHKAAIKTQDPNAIVLPMLPRATYWRFNVLILWFLCFFLKPYAIIARNVIACNMALAVKGKGPVKKVCFDGRGAIAAEWTEYDVHVVESWKKEIDKLENRAVNKSDFRIAVSEKLAEHWNSGYAYRGKNHVVIPCTLNRNFQAKIPDAAEISQNRKKLGVKEEAILFAYSGSTAGWQSFSILQNYVSHYLKKYPQCVILFLAPEEDNITKLEKEFPGQVIRKWVAHDEVTSILSACDYGLLIREQTITNKVASPTKFAEYLSAGLPVIITKNLGDYTEFVLQNNCGHVVNENDYPIVENTTIEKRKQMISLVQQYCTKQAYVASYRNMILALAA
jgi:hypothetical protein